MGLRAHRRLVARAHAWLAQGEPFWCPRSDDEKPHPISMSKPILEHGIITCNDRANGHSARCGALVYVMVLEDGNRYVAAIDPHEVKYLEKAHMSVEDTLAYLTGSPVSPVNHLRRRLPRFTTRTDD